MSETPLPNIQNWKNSLRDNKIDITQEQLEQLWKQFREFDCVNLKDFLELYLPGDVLQLACWFEELRTVCYETYGLDCVQFYTASNLSGSNLLTDRNILDLTERMIRGGLSSVYSSRLEIANNSLFSNFDESKEPSSILYIDANNLYGRVMLHYPLPLKDF